MQEGCADFLFWSELPLFENKARVKTKKMLHSRRSKSLNINLNHYIYPVKAKGPEVNLEAQTPVG
jgi:hypothetical protein